MTAGGEDLLKGNKHISAYGLEDVRRKVVKVKNVVSKRTFIKISNDL